MSTSEAITRDIKIQVKARYSPDHSNASAREWFFLYTVKITNRGAATVQLLDRHWVITDANGEVEEVRGPGVVGRQPVLGPGESFEYTSGCPLPTPFGSMHGSYRLVSDSGDSFDAEIAPFALSEPTMLH